MKFISTLRTWLLLATVFTLPMYMRVNNMLLAAFIAVSILETLLKGKQAQFFKSIVRGIPIVLFFCLAVFGAFREISEHSLKLLENHWSLLLIPLAMLPQARDFSALKRQVFNAFLWGCITTLVICYANVFREMLLSGEPIEFFFRWRHLGQQFTNIADTHPTYLAVFVVVSTFYLILDRHYSYLFKSIVIPFMILGLFQLASRIALFLSLLMLLFLVAQRIKQNKQQLVSLIFGLVLGSLLVTYYGSTYLNSRIFSADTITDQRRFARWEVSYEIFKDHPFTGVGYHKIEAFREAGYLDKGLLAAAKEADNAHNQFLEYLSTQGAIGGIVYVLCLAYLFLLAINRRDILFGFVFFAFLIANTTESMMVRIKGIEYFALFGTLFLCTVFSPKTEHEDLHHP